ncbi:S-layer homology domain-containing protein [Calidifontibacillus erzurumensis]|uniref:S-layer homology domain-containing protein n=1 Tax=Calidifontibacillus erzurumensis TaxID=2741433 RepID=UPI0035B52212
MFKKKMVFSLTSVIAATLLFATSVFAGFSDIKGHWAESIILWAEKNKIAGGYPDGTFKPDRSVTEAEFLALLIRAYDPDDRIHLKSKIHWADDEYAYALKKNYPTEGLTNIPKRNLPIDREKVAEIIAGTQGVNYTGRDAIHYLLGKGLAKGRSGEISIEGYDGAGTLTRAEAVAFIKNVLEKGLKDENGNPIMLPRPKIPSNKNDLPPLPTQPKDNEKPKPSPKPSTSIGSMDGKTLFDKTKGYAKELGYTTVEYVNTTGTFIGKNGNTGLSFTHRPTENIMSFSISDWKNEDNVKLFTRLLENYGVDSSIAVKAINKLELNSGSRIKAQGVEYSFSKRNNNGKHKVGFTIWY